MKNYLIIILVIITLLAGCKSEPTEFDLASEVADKYLKEVYDIVDFNEIESENDYYRFSIYNNEKLLNTDEYLTDHGFVELKGISYIIRVLQSAYNREMNIKVLSIQYDNVNDKSGEGKMFFDYSVELELTFSDSSTEIVNKEGKMKLLKNDMWQIDHIKETNFPLCVQDVIE